MDIGVLLNLMIHDLDIMLAFVKSPVVSVVGVGIPVLSQSEDIANARLRVANGCIRAPVNYPPAGWQAGKKYFR